MKKSVLYSLHGFLWFCNLGIIFLVSLVANAWAGDNTGTGLSIVAGSFAWSLSIFYLGYTVIVPWLFSRQKYFSFLVSAFGVCLIFPIIPHLAEVFSALAGKGWLGYSLSGYIQVFFLVLFILSSGVLFRIFIDWINSQQKKKEVDNEKLKTKLMVLYHQNNPHFIFNVLNNIDSLILSKPAKASESLHKLSNLLRYIYTNSESEKVSLKAEIEYIQNYIELQKLREDSAFPVNFEVEAVHEGIKIIPMLFLPFIENAFKHGLINKDHPVDIMLTFENKTIQFECRNHFEKTGIKENSASGFGIANTTKRLDLMYPSQYKLEIECTNGYYAVKLMLQPYEN